MTGQWRPGGKTDHEVGGDTVANVLRGALGVQQACKAAGLAREQQGAWARAFRRTALRAFDDGLEQALGHRAFQGDGLGATEFRGPLAELPVMDLVQSMALGGREGVIAVAHDGTQSRLWCAGGDIVDAESGELSGEGAVYQVLALEQGYVRAELCAVQRQRNVQRPTPALLLEAARRKDERERSVVRHEKSPAITASMCPVSAAPQSAPRWSSGYLPRLALGAVVLAAAVALVGGRGAGGAGWLAPNEHHPQAPASRLAPGQTAAPRPSSEQAARPEVVRATLSPATNGAPPAPGSAALRGLSPTSPPLPALTERPAASAQPRSRRSTASARTSPDVHAARSPESPSQRAAPPLVPRMRIIEERVPQIQIVE